MPRLAARPTARGTCPSLTVCARCQQGCGVPTTHKLRNKSHWSPSPVSREGSTHCTQMKQVRRSGCEHRHEARKLKIVNGKETRPRAPLEAPAHSRRLMPRRTASGAQERTLAAVTPSRHHLVAGLVGARRVNSSIEILLPSRTSIVSGGFRWGHRLLRPHACPRDPHLHARPR